MGVATGGERGLDVIEAQPQGVVAVAAHHPPRIAREPRGDGVDRGVADGDLRIQIDRRDVMPQRGLGGGVEPDQLLDVDGAAGATVGELQVLAVHDVAAVDAAIAHHHVPARAAAASPRRAIDDTSPLPPVVRARVHAGASEGGLGVDRRQGRQRLVVGQRHQLAIARGREQIVAAGEQELVALDRDAVAELGVERALGGVQAGDGLAARAHVGEMRGHELAHQPAATVGRAHGDDREAAHRRGATAGGEREGVGRRGGDRELAIERGQHAAGRSGRAHPVEHLRILGRVVAESVVDAVDHRGDLVGGDGADHQGAHARII